MHFAATRDNLCWTVRVIEVMLNLVEVLLDVGVLKLGKCHSKNHTDTPCKETQASAEFSVKDTKVCNFHK